MKDSLLDHSGYPVSPDETNETKVLAWLFDPGKYGDQTIIRDYNHALAYAEELICHKMDDASDEDLLKFGITINVRLIRTTVGHLRELEHEEDL